MRVIVTGSRRWQNVDLLWEALWAQYRANGAFELVHGACATGADYQAHEWYMKVGRELGCTEVRYPAAWETRGKAAGPERNRRMIEAGADLVLAFSLPGGSGTQHTMTLAREAGIEVIEHRGAYVPPIPPKRQPKGL